MRASSPPARVLVAFAATVCAVAGAQTIHEGRIVWDPLGDNPTKREAQTADPRSPSGSRTYTKDDYGISFDLKPVFSKLHRRLPTDSFRWMQDPIDQLSVGSLADDDKRRFGEQFSVTVQKGGAAVKVQLYSEEGRAMGSTYLGWFAYRYAALTPGQYTFSAPSLSSARLAPSNGGQEHRFAGVVVRREGAPGPGYRLYPQVPFALELEPHCRYEIAYLYTPAGDAGAAAEVPSPAREVTLSPSLRAAQVLDAAPGDTWIAGKPAVLRQTLTWADPDVERIEAVVTFVVDGKPLAKRPFVYRRDYGRAARQAGEDAASVIWVPKQPGTLAISSSVQARKIAGRAGTRYVAAPSEERLSVDVARRRRSLRLKFVPVAVGSWTGIDRLDRGLFDSFRKKNLAFLRGVYPLPPEQIVDTTTSDIALAPEATHEEYVVGQTRMRVLERLEALYALEKPGSVDFVIGLVPADWMNDPGVTEPTYPHAAIVSVAGETFIDTVVAHEVGHLLGMAHNPGHLPADDGAWVTAPKEFVRRDLRYDITRPERYLDFMDVDPIGSEGSWIARENYRRLAAALADR